ncbi:hypothetical protein AB7M49_004041 [Bradyrhizobium elkanii]
MHMYLARKTVLESRAIILILKDEMCFATETRLDAEITAARIAANAPLTAFNVISSFG